VSVRPAKSASRTIIVPDDCPAIQQAINRADEGDMIFVRNGLYHENVVVNKTVSLIGENSSSTIIDGTSKGNVVDVDSDNVIVGGFTIINSGGAGDAGINLHNIKNCIIKENSILNNWRGIWLHNCTNSGIYRNNISNTTESLAIWLEESNSTVISSNIISNNPCGVYLYYSDSNLVCRNRILDNNYYGLTLTESSMNLIIENVIENDSEWDGIALWSSSSNVIMANDILNNNLYGLRIGFSSNNTICHNNFVNNTIQVYDTYKDYGASAPSVNFWDDGYPSGGNYWDDYVGVDQKYGPYQNLTGTDGIGDTPYAVEGNDTDHYPLMRSYVYVLGDLNNDDKVNMIDIGIVASAFGSFPGHMRWKPEADINQDGIIDIRDIAIVARNFGKLF
jgi:parallel beta-helix repeat protein